MNPIEEIIRYELGQPDWMDSVIELSRRLDYSYHKTYRLFRLPRMRRMPKDRFIEIYNRLECEPSRISIAFLALRFVEDRYDVIQAYRMAMRKIAVGGHRHYEQLESWNPGNAGERPGRTE